MEELKQLKSVLRSLAVSSPTTVDVRALLRDYRNMMGESLPVSKYGYRDPLLFLRERCSDCFLFQGTPSNPTLTLIVPDALKHIDKFVQSQKVPSSNKFKGKRRSVPDSILGTPPPRLMPNLDTLHAKTETYKALNINTRETEKHPSEIKSVLPKQTVQPASKNMQPPEVKPSENKENLKQSDGNCSRLNLENFLRKRTAVYSSQHLDSETYKDDCSGKHTSDSGRQTSSSSSSSKRLQLEQLKEEVKQLVLNRPEGVRCLELMKLYREQYHRELNFLRFGYTSIVSFACSLEPQVLVSEPGEAGDCLLRDARTPPPPRARRPPLPLPAPRPRPRPPPRPAPHDPDDALPGIDFDPDVFPADCMHFMESIPAEPLHELAPGAMLEVMVGEVYSPSHLWLMRLGERHNIAMEDMMDEMTTYYNKGEGQSRSLALGAVRVGHYCSSIYENDWHRSLIVKIIDSDTVKVRHVDYGTVDTVSTRALRPLLRRWAALPAQALRARLAAARPPAAGRRWPRPAATALLRLVRDKRLVANVAAVDTEEDILEVFLIDTSTDKDICIGTELIREGHADPRPDSALRTSECYLYPRFHALESGATPNYAEIHAYLRDGIALDYVDDYRRHVPVEAYRPPPTPASDSDSDPSPSSSPPSTPPSPPPPHLELVNRVPVFPSRAVSSSDSGSECAASDTVTEEPCSSSSPPRPPTPPIPPPPRAATVRPARPAAAPAAPRPPPAPPRPPPPQMMMPNFMAQPLQYPSLQSLYFPMYPPYGPPPPQFYQMPSRPPMQYPAGPPMQYQSGAPLQYPPRSGPQAPPPGFNMNPGLRSAWRPPAPPGQNHPFPTPPGQYHNPPTPAPGPPYQSPTKLVEPPASETKSPLWPRSPPPPYSGASRGTGADAAGRGAGAIGRGADTGGRGADAGGRGAEAGVRRADAGGRGVDAAGRGADAGGRGGGEEMRRVSTAHGDVTLTASECEIFSLLSRVDPNAAHWYMVDAIGRRMTTSTTTATSTVASTLNPHAAEFRQVAATQTEACAGTDSLQPAVRMFMESLRPTPRPPPGFD